MKLTWRMSGAVLVACVGLPAVVVAGEPVSPKVFAAKMVAKPTADGGLVFAEVPWAWAPMLEQGPLTNAMNLRVVTDANGYLVVSSRAYTAADGPLTAMGNIRLRTDGSGHLLVTYGTAGSTVYLADGTAALPSLTFASETDLGFSRGTSGTGGINITQASGVQARLADGSQAAHGIIVSSGGHFGWNSGALSQNGTATPDLLAFRGAAGILNITDANGTPDLNLNVSGTPTLGTCGDGALATGSSNTSGRVTSTDATACTVTFSASFGGNSADCVMANLIANRGFVSAASSTAFTVTGLTAGDDFMYWCAGR